VALKLSYQTLDNKVNPTDTSKKINPFNVKGVPGCKECGGSGWKDSRHPHPCNECAKLTVPVIDTYLTKVGQTATPVVEQMQVLGNAEVTEYEDQIKMVPVTKYVEVTKNVPVTKDVTVIENVPTRQTVPVTREIEITNEVPYIRNEQYIENVNVTQQIPVTRNIEVTQNVPITRYKEVVQNVPITQTIPVTQNMDTIKVVPVTHTRQVVTNVPITEAIPFTENVEITKSIPQTHYVNVVENLPANTTITNTQETMIQPNMNMPQEIRNDLLTHGLNPSINISSSTHPISSTDSVMMRGVPGCKECGGEGQFKSKSGKRFVPCKECVKMTGNCLVCHNNGIRPDKPSDRCECMYGKK